MDDDNTTPEPNVPDENADSKPPTAFFDLNKQFGPNSYRGNNKYEKEPHYDWDNEKYKPQPIKEPISAYEEIVDDLIDIISKLLKELSKRK